MIEWLDHNFLWLLLVAVVASVLGFGKWIHAIFGGGEFTMKSLGGSFAFFAFMALVAGIAWLGFLVGAIINVVQYLQVA
tara:strand:+ start:107271 stop:107507 length:237 start_codon:yes stop_codon:yes gene_type:complete